ncbi:MAG: putative zinc protease [Opitutia bacterium UBA7350]|nr:MAG: putative zinc protease [Opitutae bacterium UBA7350]
MSKKAVHRFLISIFAVMTSHSSLPAQDAPSGFTHLETLSGIESYILDKNGLRILLMPDKQSPVAAVMVTYDVGGRHESTGTTGATHILEHMMFKGTKNFADDTNYSSTMERIGARSNATTYYDRTNYYAVLAREFVPLAIELEADRMRNLRILPEDLESEMTVVRNEYELGENNPVRTLIKEVYASAFMAHPYGHPVIGWRSDIENTTTEKLRQFYDTFYWPENTTLTIIGGFDRQATMRAILKNYGSIPNAPKPIPVIETVEPEQLGERRLTIERAGEVGVITLAHKVPEGTHHDWAALSLIELILGADQTGRLYRSLDDKGKASQTFSFAPQLHDPSLFFLGAFLTPEASHAEVENLIIQEIETLITGGVSEAELQRAKSVIEAQTVYNRDGSYRIASAINECIALGDWRTYLTLPDAIQKVTPAEIQRAAKKYLTQKNRTTGWFIPQKSERPTQVSLPTPNYFRDPALQNHPEAERSGSNLTTAERVNFAPHIREKNIGPIRLVTIDMPVEKVVAFVGSFAAGNAHNPDENPLVASLTAQMLNQGTKRNDRFVLAESLDTLGAELSFQADKQSLVFSGKFLRNDAGYVIDLLAEQLRLPAFEAAVFANLKERTRANILRANHDTDYRASAALTQLIYPSDHPNYYFSIEQQLAALEKTTTQDLRQFHEAHYGPASMTMVFAGDIDFDQISAALAAAFENWEGGKPYPEISATGLAPKFQNQSIQIPDKTSVSVRLGQFTGLKRTDADYLPFAVGNYILGGSFHSRLMTEIRVKQGLTYSIHSSHSGDILTPGHWTLSAGFAPELLEKGQEASLKVIRQWVDQGVSTEEVNAACTTLNGKYLVGLDTTTAVAGQIHSFLKRGYPANYVDTHPKKLATITADEVNKAIQKYLDSDAMAGVTAGSLP